MAQRARACRRAFSASINQQIVSVIARTRAHIARDDRKLTQCKASRCAAVRPSFVSVFVFVAAANDERARVKGDARILKKKKTATFCAN